MVGLGNEKRSLVLCLKNGDEDNDDNSKNVWSVFSVVSNVSFSVVLRCVENVVEINGL